MSAKRCPSPEMLLAVHEDVLPDELAREVREHLAGCELCAQLLQGLREPALSEPTLDELTRMRRKVLGPQRRTSWYAAIAAAVGEALAPYNAADYPRAVEALGRLAKRGRRRVGSLRAGGSSGPGWD